MDAFLTKNNEATKKTEGSSIQLVTFLLGNAEYGIDIMQAQSIIKMDKITLIPNAPDFVEGVINLRGNVIPVIDLKKRFHLEESEGESNTGIIIVKVGEVEMGIIIDTISKVIYLSEDKVQPPPPVFAGIGQKYIKGVGKVGDKLLIILDLDKLLSMDEQDLLKEI